jgi:hypothetical protein
MLGQGIECLGERGGPEISEAGRLQEILPPRRDAFLRRAGLRM